MEILAVKTVPSQMRLFWRMKFISGHSGGGKSKINVLVSYKLGLKLGGVCCFHLHRSHRGTGAVFEYQRPSPGLASVDSSLSRGGKENNFMRFLCNRRVEAHPKFHMWP
ncbi:uncharacterized protein WM277_011102 [Molossus nigricans]